MKGDFPKSESFKVDSSCSSMSDDYCGFQFKVQHGLSLTIGGPYQGKYLESTAVTSSWWCIHPGSQDGEEEDGEDDEEDEDEDG